MSEPATKRLKTRPAPAQNMDPDQNPNQNPPQYSPPNPPPSPNLIVEVATDGDVVLVVQGMAGVVGAVGIRVSSVALSLASPVFKRLLTQDNLTFPPPGEDRFHLIGLARDDDGDAIFLLCNVLHLRNNALPAKIQVGLLFSFANACRKYECITAASRVASQWFDYIYAKLDKSDGRLVPVTPATPSLAVVDAELTQLIETTIIFDDALFFGRFTARWTLTRPVVISVNAIPADPPRRALVRILKARQSEIMQMMRIDLDLLVDPLADTISANAVHYTDCAPGAEPQPEDIDDAEFCRGDKDAAVMLLASLKDAGLWPGMNWSCPVPHGNIYGHAAPTTIVPTSGPRSVGGSVPPLSRTIQAMAKLFAEYQVPESDQSGKCCWCSPVEDRFSRMVHLVKGIQADRMWGLCLDCYRAKTEGEGDAPRNLPCRYEHYKPGVDGGTSLPQPTQIGGIGDEQ